MKSKNKAQKTNFNWDYHVPKINNGKETIDEMSLIVGLYENYLVTKTGDLVGMVDVSGINLDLLNSTEQEDVFSDYSAFLMSTVGANYSESLQFIEATIPVDMTTYLNHLKTTYLNCDTDPTFNPFKEQLLASYLDYYISQYESKAMTTKQHLVVVKTKIKDKTKESLALAVDTLDEKMNQLKRDLEEGLFDFSIKTRILTNQEVLAVLKNLLNFKD